MAWDEKEYQRRYKAKHGDRLRQQQWARNVVRRCGITVDDIERMKVEQGGACALCGEIPSNTLHVDHDHASGRVRELLCSKCNQGLGLFRESPRLLLAAADYLLKHHPEKGE